MRINGKEIIHNERMTYSQIEYLQARLETLAKELERGYDVNLETSNMSEAGYITINGQEVSFRNHDYFNGIPKDYTVWLSHFNTWTDAKAHFKNKILPMINNEDVEDNLNNKKERSVEDLIKNTEENMKKQTDPNVIAIFERRIKRLKESL